MVASDCRGEAWFRGAGWGGGYRLRLISQVVGGRGGSRGSENERQLL